MKVPFNLQFFAGGEPTVADLPESGTLEGTTEITNPTEGAEPEEVEEPEVPPQPEKSMYSEEDFKKLQQQQEEAVAKAVEAALKKASMSAEEKADLEKKEAEDNLLKREQELAFRELKADTKTLLADKKIPAGFLDMVVGKDLEETKGRITTFKTEFDKAVQEQVEQRLRGKTPERGNGTASQGSNETIRDTIRKNMI